MINLLLYSTNDESEAIPYELIQLHEVQEGENSCQ